MSVCERRSKKRLRAPVRNGVPRLFRQIEMAEHLDELPHRLGRVRLKGEVGTKDHVVRTDDRGGELYGRCPGARASGIEVEHRPKLVEDQIGAVAALLVQGARQAARFVAG